MVGRSYKKLAVNIVQSLKPFFGKKLMWQLMPASNLLKNYHVILLMKVTEYN